MNDNKIDSKLLLEAITPDHAINYNVRKIVFAICPDPFESNSNPLEVLKFGYKVSMDIAKRTESPVLCYAPKLAMYGFQQWTIRVGPISKQHLFDIQVSQMLRCHYVAVYGKEVTESMQNLLDVAKIRMSRIDFRNV